MVSGDHYICTECKYEWRTRKDVGIPSICPHCKGHSISTFLDYKFDLARQKEYERQKEQIRKEKEEILEKQKKEMKPFPIKGWHWIFYILGWYFGAIQLAFWIYAYLAYKIKDGGYITFIKYNPKFHKRVEYWGIFSTALVVIIIILAVFNII